MPKLTSVRPAVAVIAGATLAVAGALVAVSPAYAAGSTYYVATSGDDSTGDGSQGAPFATIAKAVDVAVDGDTISVGAGTFAGPVVAEDLTLQGDGTTVIPDMLQLSPGSEGSTVTGFHFTSATNQLWAVGLDGSDTTTIDGNLFDMPSSNADQYDSVLDSSSKGLTVSNNTFEGDGTRPDAVAVNLIGPGMGDIVVTGNDVTGYGSFVVGNANAAGGLEGLTVTGNTIVGSSAARCSSGTACTASTSRTTCSPTTSPAR